MLSLEPLGDPTPGTDGTDGTDGTWGTEGTWGTDGTDGTDGRFGAGRFGVGKGRFGATVGTGGSDGVATGGSWATAGAATMIASPTPNTRPVFNPSSVPEVPGSSHSNLTSSIFRLRGSRYPTTPLRETCEKLRKSYAATAKLLRACSRVMDRLPQRAASAYSMSLPK